MGTGRPIRIIVEIDQEQGKVRAFHEDSGKELEASMHNKVRWSHSEASGGQEEPHLCCLSIFAIPQSLIGRRTLQLVTGAMSSAAGFAVALLASLLLGVGLA